MKDTILICAVAAVFLFGYFLMDKVDRFLENNHGPASERPADPTHYIAFKNPNCELHLFSGSADDNNCLERKKLKS